MNPYQELSYAGKCKTSHLKICKFPSFGLVDAISLRVIAWSIVNSEEANDITPGRASRTLFCEKYTNKTKMELCTIVIALNC